MLKPDLRLQQTISVFLFSRWDMAQGANAYSAVYATREAIEADGNAVVEASRRDVPAIEINADGRWDPPV